MKITAISLGSYGDIMPFILLGEELTKRGYVYNLATFESYKAVIEKKGLMFSKISGDSDEVVSVLLGNSNNTRDEGINGISFLLNKYPELYDDFYKACKNSDVIVYMQFGALAYHFAEKFNIPVIRTFAFPFDPTKQFCSLMPDLKRNSIFSYMGYFMCYIFMSYAAMKTVNVWRNRLVLKKWNVFRNYRKMKGKKILTLYQYDEVLANKDKNWGRHIYLTGNWIRLDSDRDDKAAKELSQFIDNCKKVVYVGFGSMNYDEAESLYKRIITILLKEGKGIILPESCSSLLNREFKSYLHKLFTSAYIPFEQFLYKVDAAIHHGGNGTVHACLRNGKPQLVISFGADQTFWGNQCFCLGVGPKPIDIKKPIVTKEFENRIIDLINNSKYKTNAEKFSEAVTDNGISVAADIIQREFPLEQY